MHAKIFLNSNSDIDEFIYMLFAILSVQRLRLPVEYIDNKTGTIESYVVSFYKYPDNKLELIFFCKSMYPLVFRFIIDNMKRKVYGIEKGILYLADILCDNKTENSPSYNIFYEMQTMESLYPYITGKFDVNLVSFEEAYKSVTKKE